MAALAALPFRAQAQEWACVQRDAQHTGRSPRVVSDFPHVTKWRVEPGGSILGSPIIRGDGSIVVGNGHGRILSAWSALGAPLWSYPATGGILGAAGALADGKVLFSDLDGKIYTLNADGSFNASYQNTANPKVERRLISDMTPRPGGGYATADWMHNLIMNTGGAANQIFALGDTIYPHAPVTLNSAGTLAYVVIRPNANQVRAVCVNTATAAQVWSRQFAHSIGSKLTSQMSGVCLDEANSRLFFCANYHAESTGAFLYALASTDGVKKTNFPVDLATGSYATPALSPDGSAVYITTLDGRLLKIDAVSGATLWSYDSGAQLIRGSAVVDSLGRVVFGDMNGSIHCVRNDGTLLWKHNGDGSIVAAPPAIAEDGEVVYATANGTLVRVEPEPVVIPYLDHTPTLDGKLSFGEWTGAWKASIDVETNPAFNPGWDTPLKRTLSRADCSYEMYLMHDGESLYVALDVNDDTISARQAPVPDSPPAGGTAADLIYEVWYDDCTEVFIDTDRDGVNENIDDLPNWAEGIHLHLGVLGHFWSKPDHPDRGGVFGTTWEKAWWGAASLRPGGYVHEYRLKMSEFDTENGPGFTPLKPGDMIGLNVLANDDDEHNPPNENDRREDQVTWWGAEAAGYDAFKFAQTWPRALLSPDIQRNEAGASWARYR